MVCSGSFPIFLQSHSHCYALSSKVRNCFETIPEKYLNILIYLFEGKI